MSTKSTRTATRPPARPVAKAASRTPSKQRVATKAARNSARPAPEPTGTKQSQLIAMLRSPAGGTMEQITVLTGWQPHSVRGTISGTLRKRLKLNVTCIERVYRIAEAQA